MPTLRYLTAGLRGCKLDWWYESKFCSIELNCYLLLQSYSAKTWTHNHSYIILRLIFESAQKNEPRISLRISVFTWFDWLKTQRTMRLRNDRKTLTKSLFWSALPRLWARRFWKWPTKSSKLWRKDFSRTASFSEAWCSWTWCKTKILGQTCSGKPCCASFSCQRRHFESCL